MVNLLEVETYQPPGVHGRVQSSIVLSNPERFVPPGPVRQHDSGQLSCEKGIGKISSLEQDGPISTSQVVWFVTPLYKWL